MVKVAPNLDSTVVHIEKDTGKPTKDFFNWMKGVSDRVRQLSDQVDALLAAAGPDGPGAPAAFSVNHSTTQTLASGVYTQLVFNTEIYDVGGHFVSSAWTPPAGKVHLAGSWDADATTFNNFSVVAAAIFKNGVNRKSAFGVSLNTTFGSCHIACDDICNGTDVYTLRAFVSMSSGAATARSDPAQTWFTGHWISP